MVAAPHRPTCTPSQKTPELCEGSGKPDGRPSIEIYAGHHDKPSLTAAPISAGRQHRIALSGRGWRLERLGGVCPEIRDDTHGHTGPELRNQRVSVAIVFHEPEGVAIPPSRSESDAAAAYGNPRRTDRRAVRQTDLQPDDPLRRHGRVVWPSHTQKTSDCDLCRVWLLKVAASRRSSGPAQRPAKSALRVAYC